MRSITAMIMAIIIMKAQAGRLFLNKMCFRKTIFSLKETGDILRQKRFSLLEKIIPALQQRFPVAVIEGDQQTTNDADRIQALGVPVIQINTGSGCHLDALMVNRAVKELDLQDNSLLCIENVGNLVCPALFDLGEALKVVIISVTEGDDKPLKYPTMFHEADLCILNKIDLLPYVEFDVARCRENAMRVNHHLEWFELSAKTGEGLTLWQEWLEKKLLQH
jgi:hydrogenase nickel incorporation protein HypB